MITVSAAPRVGEQVQAGTRGQIVGTLVDNCDPRVWVVATRNGTRHRCMVAFVFLLSERWVSIPVPSRPDLDPWEGPLERAGEHHRPGRFQATSEPSDGATHIGYVDVPESGVPTWTCADTCTIRPLAHSQENPS